MMQVPAPAVVAAQRGANDPALLLCDKTEARIAVEKCGDRGARVGFVQPHAFAALPQSDDFIIIFDAKYAEDYSVIVWGLGKNFFHSTVTLLARLRGLSTSQPRATAM
jgi:hypothetical protein